MPRLVTMILPPDLAEAGRECVMALRLTDPRERRARDAWRREQLQARMRLTDEERAQQDMAWDRLRAAPAVEDDDADPLEELLAGLPPHCIVAECVWSVGPVESEAPDSRQDGVLDWVSEQCSPALRYIAVALVRDAGLVPETRDERGNADGAP